ncbi:MAG TPA: hypothetical protein VN673_05725, partial [Clostridia bacterium]|nr:hypothetical protein [Clostridia bacterium]
PDEVVTLTSEKFRDGWTYGLDIPNLVEKNRYVRGVVQVCLQELANRTATVRSAELPQWLVEGLTEQILSSSEEEVILQAPGQSPNGVRFSPTVFESKRLNPLESLHKKLTTDTVLSFEELSWPTPNAFFGATGERYRQSAQLFIRALVELENGRTKLRSMVERLSQYHNWQFALLDSYQAHFRRPLDVEKWWTLRALYFTSRELGQTWPVQESWEKLDAILNPAVQIYAATNDLPLHASVNLQTIVRDWERTEKSAALQRAAVSLAQLRLRVSPELVPLVHEYLETLARFLENQERWADKDLPQQAIEPTLRRLDQLDDQARVMREPGSSPANTGTQTVQARSRANPAVNSSTRPAERNDWNPQRMLVRRRGSPVTRTW